MRQARNQNGQVKDVPGFGSHYEKGSYNNKYSLNSDSDLGGGDRGDYETRRNGCDLLQQCPTNVESARRQQPVNTHFREQYIKTMSQKKMRHWYDTT